MRHPIRLVAVAAAATLLLSACTDDGSGDGTTDGGTTVAIPDDIESRSAEELVTGLYEDSDVDLATALIAEGSVPEEIRDDVRTSLGGLLDGPVEVNRTETHDVEGVTIEEVVTADGIRWCVRPDRRILLQCRVGIADVEIDVGDLELEVVEAEVDVFPEEYQLRLQLRASGEDPVQFPGLLTLYGEDGNPASLIQTQAALANSGEIVAQVSRDTAALPGTTLLLAWVTDVGASLDQELELRWDEGALPVRIDETDWYVG